ncbi:ABC transporter substrate-binding protein [Terrabacter sp. NPDC000476]|uniref:ABC transporter substrate-binding protein n=1 Tax=Terrabacter sp. NPDC000476 TaxID=3154258 RepID=UPI0033294A83
MRPVRSSAILALSLSMVTVGLAACGGSDGGSSTSTYAVGKTFTLALSADPGALDPQGSASSPLFQVSKFAYDTLVSVDAKGQVTSGLASKWSVDGKTVTFEIAPKITCADGSAFTAQTAADNISYVEDPKNKSPFLGVFVPAGATAKASGSTLTVTLATTSPFVLDSFSNLPMVCDAGMKDRASLKAGTAGTGPYTLKEAVPGDHYTYAVRTGYTWGPGGATTATAGMPATIQVKIVPNETTAANQLLSGALNAAAIHGPDAARLEAAKLDHEDAQAIVGQQWYNHAKGHDTSDPAVRQALTQALDLAQLQKVITSDRGGPATQLAVVAPAACTGSSVEGSVPGTDLAAAGAALDAAGWVKGADGMRAKAGKPLSLSFLYDASLGSGGSAASELAVDAWKKLGVTVKAKQLDENGMVNAMFGTGDWDIAWEPLNINTPEQGVPFFSGPAVTAGGNNMSGITNAEYTSHVTSAMGKVGTDSCPDWLAAEAALFKANDVVLFANSKLPFFSKGAELDVLGSVVPTSIRMLG